MNREQILDKTMITLPSLYAGYMIGQQQYILAALILLALTPLLADTVILQRYQLTDQQKEEIL